jgi:ADP-dependent NAD(P)H-hydrate dehydratase / NAD(P)H-hydrate epimerase
MKLFTTKQIAEIDRYTIENEPITDLDLMERAACMITDRLIALTGKQQNLIFFAGPGNNGGDALAVARLISHAGYSCEVYVMDLGKSISHSAAINLQRLEEQGKATIHRIRSEKDFPVLNPGDWVTDGLFGSGLTRPLDGLAAALVKHINRLTAGSQVSGIRYQDMGHGAKSSEQMAQSTELRAKNDLREQTDLSDLSDPDSNKSEIAYPKSEIFEPQKTQKNTEENFPLRLSDFAIGSEVKVIAIDVPSGLMGEDNSVNDPSHIIRAKATITLQFPKISLLFPENNQFAGKVFIEDIGLHPDAIKQIETPFFMTDRETVYPWFKPRSKAAHKGDFGHALLVAGSYGKMGAALLASQACLRTGAGLVTTHLPECGYDIQQTYMPEVMCSIDENKLVITGIPDLDPYKAVGAGPGLGTHPETQNALKDLLQKANLPMVLDADALNILSLHPEWLQYLPPGTILTPHPGEFKRLTGDAGNSLQRLAIQREISQKYGIIIVLKGAHTTVSLPDGKVWFNTSGNPGMATGGSGDVLTGIILGLLAQGFSPGQAAIAGVFIHGEAGDIAAGNHSELSMTATDITAALPVVFKQIYTSRESDF